MRPISIAECLRLAEDDIADFEARMRGVSPTYRVGDRVEVLGETYEVASFQREGTPGYWLKRPGEDALFLPLDLEEVLRSVVH
jgi:hypothetical protein